MIVDIDTIASAGGASTDEKRGARAAQLIWDDDPQIENISDPRTSGFASAVVAELARLLQRSGGVVRKVMQNATEAAADLNVSKFQGLVEIIQNADDLQATEVRFAVRQGPRGQQLLIVHDGLPVTCHHVLGMALPYLTTKTNRVDQRGRFGIGLKTLTRIADSITVHSAPYHFSLHRVSLTEAGAEPALEGFYVPVSNTLLVLDLNEGFNPDELQQWFSEWKDDGLLFLGFVEKFRWCDTEGQAIADKRLAFGPWEPSAIARLHEGVLNISQRQVRSEDQAWTVWKATVHVPENLHPDHKARSDTTDISIAMPQAAARGTLYIGFKTLVPVSMPFSLDGQFDPSTAREGVIQNDWNEWLIARCGEVVGDVAGHLLATKPRIAWTLIPVNDEHIGKEEDRWLRARFDATFAQMRVEFGESASVLIGEERIALTNVAYEQEALSGLLTPADVEALSSGARALPQKGRDADDRWRIVLNLLDVSKIAGTTELLAGFDHGLFITKDTRWWVDAADRLTGIHPDDELFGRPFWLGEDRQVLACHRPDETDRPLVFAGVISAFAERWKLLDRLNSAYGMNGVGENAIQWLEENAAFARQVTAATELAAFAERFTDAPLEIKDADLREIRDRFDDFSDEEADELGRKVGAALLLDGQVFKSEKPVKKKASPTRAYLCKTLDGDHPNWPVAAGTIPGIEWIAARYEEQLKTGATRARRRRNDGTISRGARRFLMLLGAEVTPRLERTGTVRGGGSATRVRELRAAGAEQVEYDYVSPDLDRVVKELHRTSNKAAKSRSPALLRALSRNWERVYAGRRLVPAEHVARVHTYDRGSATASWLNELRETEWMAVGRGERVRPSEAVIKTPETQTLYEKFVIDVAPSEVADGLATSLKLIMDVRIGDLLSLVAEMRDGKEPLNEDTIVQIYRSIARHCPKSITWNARVGELTVQDLRHRFSDGKGLIYVAGEWRRPDEMIRGKDIFHDRRRFVPSGPTTASLWLTLDVREPDLDDCIRFCRTLAAHAYDMGASATLMDLYRYIERLLPKAERRHRARLKVLPVACFDTWVSERPVILIEDPELRAELAKALPRMKFWTPPCDTRDLPELVSLVGILNAVPTLRVLGNRERALERGEGERERFARAVDHLSDELARNDPATRQKLRGIGWDDLKSIPLFAYEQPISVQASHEALGSTSIAVALRAVAAAGSELHVEQDALGHREFGGRAIASFFDPDVRRKIDGEWVLAWQKSLEGDADAIRLASDKEHREAMEEQADKINTAPRKKIKVSSPASRQSSALPRTLKETVGAVTGATVIAGSQPTPTPQSSSTGLSQTPLPPSASPSPESMPAQIAYTNQDLEQRGWELLLTVLNNSDDQQIVDLRKRHGVGADGAIDWKTFVEMKATGRGPQSSIEMSNTQYERANERGLDFILALVSGLETGQKDEVRLIFDPANRVALMPVNGVRLTGLLDAPCVLVSFDD